MSCWESRRPWVGGDNEGLVGRGRGAGGLGASAGSGVCRSSWGC